ncbi:MAG TPA: glycosyltransferase family 1 protein [Pyrinomonadaceae bacterium]|nr:glycosyltransferase family 1 protein [Pyrinomonadaceae bacterium]
MRIGIDGIPLASPKTGIGHYTFELARSLAQLAPEEHFELLAPVPIELSTSVVDPAENDLPANLRSVHAPVNTLRRRWWTIGLPLYVQQNGLALFHGTNYNVPLWQRCPTIVTVHDLSLLLHPDTHREDLVKRARWRLPRMTRVASHIITDSESVKTEVRDHLGVPATKITTVPLAPRKTFHPVSAAESRETLRRLGAEDKFILFVGTVEPRKNLITLVRAFDELLRTMPLGPQLVITGQKGWLTDGLYDSVEKSAVSKRILFTGYVTDVDLRALYSACSVAVYPSLYEGFGLPPLEAMACGAPVITSQIPVMMETASGAARLVDPTSVHELTAALVELLTDEGAREKLRALGLKRAAEYTWERTASQTMDVYREVLARPQFRKKVGRQGHL